MSLTTYLMGGCANQMFMYATGLALSRWMGTDLLLDVSRFSNPNEFRLYSLGLFAGVNEPQVHEMRGRVIREAGMPYNPELFSAASGECSIFGYWQTEKYFADLKDELRARFVPRQALPSFHQEMEEKILAAGDRSIFLTVRRTDYVGNNFHGLLPMEYYLAALEVIKRKIPKPVVFVFSDEPQWCAQHFALPCESYIAGNYDRTVPGHLGREDAELRLMSQCSHAIMANSSYSWWAAWLGPDNRDGIIVAPKNWFGPASHEDIRDIVPDRWIKI